MKAKKILTLIVALAMCLASVSSLTAITAFAADTVILDTNVKANITKAGAAADDKNVNKTKYSVKWKTDDGDLFFKNLTKDFTAGSKLNFSVKLDSTEDAQLMVYFGSENPSTNGIDYYGYDLKLSPGAWQDISIDLTKLTATRTPLGWNQMDLSFRVKGWSNKAAAGSVVYIENIYLSGDKMSASSSTVTESAENEANKTKVFYWADYNDPETALAKPLSVAPKSNTITHKVDSGDNGYVNLTSAGAEDGYIEAQIGSTKINKMVVSVDISTSENIASGNLQYKDTGSPVKQGTLFSFSNGAIKIGDKEAAKVKAGEWTKLAFIIDFTTCKATAFVDGKEFGTFDAGATSNDISRVRVYMSKSEANSGKDILVDNFAVYGGDAVRDVSGEYTAPEQNSTNAGAAYTAKAGADVEMVLPELSQIGDGVALMINKSDAYAKGAMTKVDAQNEAVVPVIVDSRTLVPVRFISENFGAEVNWDDAARKVTVTTADKTIELTIDSNVMTVNGAEQTIDVPAAIMEERTMLPLRALVESLGKNVLWDTRGLIVITDPSVTLDAEKDVKLSTMLIGKIENGIEANNYAAAPKFTQSIIDEAVAAECSPWSARSGNSNGAEKSANIIYYLTLAARFDPKASATNGTLAKDAALKQLRYLIAGGHEPFACVGCYWGHAVVASALLLVKNTPVVYDELTADEKDRMDWLMRALAIAGNWGYNDQNNYSTGFDLMGNFGKGWNPNYRNTYLSVVLSASMYFGAEELDKIYTEFDYDTYVKKYEELGFTNILATWKVAGKELMEKGGECFLLGGIGLSWMEAGQSGGKGAGVKIPFLYNGKGPEDTYGLFTNLVKFTYAYNVISGYGTPGTDDHCYVLTGKTSPYEGQMGMMKEFAGSDGGAQDGRGSNIRSRCVYGYDSYEILCSVYANMKLIGGWDSSTKEMRELDNRIFVGNEDLIFKMSEGYMGYSSGKGSAEYEYGYLSRGHKFVKDIWRNFHCMLNEQVTTAKNPNEEVLVEIPTATPKEGDGTAPEGSFANVQLNANSKFPNEAYYSIGKDMTSGTVEFDIVLGNDITISDYDCVVMLAQKAEGKTWGDANMLIQFTAGTIKIRNGGAYALTGIQYGANYRYHAKVTFDVPTRKYSVELTQTYPTAGTTYKVADYDFRKAGQEIEKIDSIAVVNTPNNSIMWVENFKIVE